jgi:hypothetical protein
MFSTDALFVDAAGEYRTIFAEVSQKTHHPESFGVFCNSCELNFSVRIEEFFTVITSFSPK